MKKAYRRKEEKKERRKIPEEIPNLVGESMRTNDGENTCLSFSIISCSICACVYLYVDICIYMLGDIHVSSDMFLSLGLSSSVEQRRDRHTYICIYLYLFCRQMRGGDVFIQMKRALLWTSRTGVCIVSPLYFIEVVYVRCSHLSLGE